MLRARTGRSGEVGFCQSRNWDFKQNKRSRPCTRGMLLYLLAHFEHVISDASALDQAAIPDTNHAIQP